MSINLIKEEIRTMEAVCEKYSQTMVECDVIVPDVKPDIKKVLEVSGTVSITQKLIQQDKVFLQGVVRMTVLYVPDGESPAGIKSLFATQEFTHTTDCHGITPEMQLLAQAEPESFDSTLINSRKLNLRCILGIGIKVSKPTMLEIATDLEEDSQIALKKEPIRTLCATANAECQIILREQLEMPSGKPTIGEILKIGATPVAVELCMMDNKAVAKGQVRVCTLYLSEDENHSVEFVEHMLPFTEILDAEGIREDMEGEVEYHLKDMYYELRENNDGEARLLGLELVLGALLRGSEIREVSAISDAYSLDGELEMVCKNHRMEQLLAHNTAELTVKDQAQIPPMLPAISQICDVHSVAKIDRITAGQGQVTVYGTVQTWILYLTKDEHSPIAELKHISEFSHSFDVKDAAEDTACDARIFVEHTSYTLSGENGIELRFILGLSVKSLKTGTVCLIESITETTPETPHQHPCMVLYFVQKGDTLWSIAKRYRTTVDAIKSLNRLESDLIYPGQQIKIIAQHSAA